MWPMREQATQEHGGRGTSQTQTIRSRSGFWRNGLCCDTVDARDRNVPDPQETQSDESHAENRCEQRERGSMHHSTKEVACE